MPRPQVAEPWWTPWPGIGPGYDLLGDLTGAHVVELGCGTGDNAAAFACAGAYVVGVDSSGDKIARAVTRWGHLAGVQFVHAEAGDHLAATSNRYDVVCSIFGALSFSPVTPLLRRITSRLSPAGTFALSTRLPHIAERAAGPPSTPAGWIQLLAAHSLTSVRLTLIPHPTAPDGRACLLIKAAATASRPATWP